MSGPTWERRRVAYLSEDTFLNNLSYFTGNCFQPILFNVFLSLIKSAIF